MGIFSNVAAAQNFFLQSTQPISAIKGALWINSGDTPRPELRIFDGTDWNQEDPVGSIIPFGGAVASIPTGWLLCDDSAVSRTTFSNLFDAIGTFYGTGDGSTTFNVPDLRGKFSRGAPAGNDPGSSAGVDTVTLTADQSGLPAHSHTIDAVANTSGSADISKSSPDLGGLRSTNTTGPTNASESHDNLPSYQEVIYIIKT